MGYRALRILCDSVELKKAKTDEHGRAVHDECYVQKPRLKGTTPDST